MSAPSQDAAPLASVALARSPIRLLVGPVLVVAGGLLGLVAAWVMVPMLGPLLALAIGALGIVAVAGGVLAAISLLSVRLDVEVDGLRLRWARGGERVYRLAAGPVTRIRLEGEEAARVRPRLGAFGWMLGAARLHGGEQIEVVRLASTPTLLLVPTERGRLAIGTSDEGELVRNLAAAARIRQRYEELAIAAPPRVALPIETGEPAPLEPEPAAVSAAASTATVAPPPDEREAGAAPSTGATSLHAVAEPDSGERVLTGIERTRLEERLAAERAAALARAEAERREAEQAAAAATMAGAVRRAVAAPPLGPRPVSAAVVRRRVLPHPRARVRMTWQRPWWLSGKVLVAAVPIAAAGAVWGAASVTRLWPLGEPSGMVAATLALCGPGATAAGLLAARYWPRLTGLVVSTALCGLLLLGRSLV